ncbi:MAG: diacylglycerol kinase family protein [Streptococcus sp.]|nr:diacylglycerol kinase family protein [Streptococcus sp.]
MDLKENDTKRKWKNRTLTASMEFALTGIKTAYREEANMRNHVISAIFAILSGVLFRISVTEWIFLLLSIFLVIAFEIINSAIECVVDLATDYHFNLLAKKAKDMAAGAVLLVSVYALLTGLLIFVPKLWALIFH